MKTKPLTFLLALTFLFLFSGSSAVFADELQDGWDASARGDYKNTHKLWLPLAKQGNAEAQYLLGLMYDEGKGVLQDYKEAFKWNRLSAEQGVVSAQYDVGVMYANGQGVPQDYVSAHMWFNLCASNGRGECREERNKLEKKMSPSQIGKAQEMARNWKPTKK